MNKEKVFEKEIGWIENSKIKEFTSLAVSMLPDYFFEVAASSTGKYHPEYACGPGGLVRHTKAAAMIAHELLNLEMYGKYSPTEKDLMLAAIILHDGWKHGSESTAGAYTVAKHPVVCSEWIESTPEFKAYLTDEQIAFVSGCIASHMGQWNTDYRSKQEIMPKPVTSAQRFVHQADYLASRKYLIFDFEDDYYTPEKSDPSETVSDNSSSDADELSDIKSKILTLCKEKIANGANKDSIYSLISEKTGGNKNPNSIKDIAIASEVLKSLEETDIG